MKKMDRIWIIAVLGVFTLAACGKKETPATTESKTSSMAETGKKICDKVVDCAMEQFKGLPEAQRKMAEGMMAKSKEACLGQYGAKGGSDPVEKIDYTQEELDVGMKCLDEMLKTSCQDLMRNKEQPPSCKKFQEITEKKRPLK